MENIYSIDKWVEESDNPRTREFRQAVHIILDAITSSDELKDIMIIKGGILLAIRYHSARFTKDIDFSTSLRYGDFKDREDGFLKLLDAQLSASSEKLEYGLDCKIQSYELMPPDVEASFPTLKIRASYAYKGSKKHKLFAFNKCPDVVHIDFSFNELNFVPDTFYISPENTINAYSLVDLVAEKYRAIIQQKSRNRIRRQDAYDIYCLIESGVLNDHDLKPKILSSLKIKSESRGLILNKTTLDDKEIIRRSKEDYYTLSQEVPYKIPDFEPTYRIVNEYYKSLPWTD